MTEDPQTVALSKAKLTPLHEPEITEPINAVSIFDDEDPRTEEEKKAEEEKKDLEATGKDWYKRDRVTIGINDEKLRDGFEAKELGLRVGPVRNNRRTFDLITNPDQAPSFPGEESKQRSLVRSLYYQHKIAEFASHPKGVFHFVLNGKPVVAFRDFKKGKGETGGVPPPKEINKYLNSNGISTDPIMKVDSGYVHKGKNSNFLLIGIKEKPMKYEDWKAKMQAKYGTAADILP